MHAIVLSDIAEMSLFFDKEKKKVCIKYSA
jgi:hypothetical protein